MKTAIHILCLSVLPLFTFGQTSMWTWMKGDTVANPPVNYGTLGIEAASNTPAGLYEVAEWTDLQGNFWLFGGVSMNGNNGVGNNNLWKFNPQTNNWTWVKGPGFTGDAGSYGMMGVPALSNNPPARLYCSASWTDLFGDFWFFGGYNNAFYSDLWKYNIASNMWTWMKGPSISGTPVTGTMGVPNNANHPGGRAESSAAWVDANNNLWLFGGIAGSNGYCRNDLWCYNTSTDQWTWMKGPNAYNNPGSYGFKGVPASSNLPPARHVYTAWEDNGNFWLFGGRDTGSHFYNDMWRYEPATNNWTWMSGTNGINDTGTYGAACSPSTDYAPVSRYETRSKWKDTHGNFWLYGGASDELFANSCSDLWYFNPTTLEWKVVKGNSSYYVAPVYGTRGTGAVANTPGGRSGAVSWFSNTGELYLFGGTVNAWQIFYNDVWKFTIDSCCVDPQHCSANCQSYNVTVNADLPVFCSGDSVRVCAPRGYVSYLWNNGKTDSCIYALQAGYYYVTVTDTANCTGTSNHLAVSTYPLLPVSISVTGDTLTAYNAVTYQWYFNDNRINGANSAVYVADQTGNYTLEITDTNGCHIFSNPISVVTGIGELQNSAGVKVYPNPSSGTWQLEADNNWLNGIVEVCDVNGRLVFKTVIQNAVTKIFFETSRGVYTLHIYDGERIIAQKLVKW